MKKLIALLVGVLVTLTGQAAAQGPGETIAYDACQYEYYLTGGYGSDLLICDVFLIGDGTPFLDGSTTAHVGDGIGPVWSRDGMRLAFTGSREPGIFVLNLSDWSRVKVYGGGESPAWSPDGMKLAIAALELYLIAADGSTSTQVTNNVGFVGQPAWSPDGGTIAFDCEVESGNRDICSIYADGTGFVRLTSDPASDSGAIFSPDGFTITFTNGSIGIALMNPDGTEIRPGDVPYAWVGIPGTQSAWSPDGTKLVYVLPFEGGCQADGYICPDYIVIANVAGTEQTFIAGGNRPAWTLSVHPVARFVAQPCNGLTCTFDGSASWQGSGSASYTWNFGDGTSDTGPTPTHTYAAVGTYSVTLTVTDDLGVAGTLKRVLEVVNNLWPTASFSHVCIGLKCTFDGSGSSDPDGWFSYFWSFGDGNTSSSNATVSHTYNSDGTFTATLTVTDSGAGTGTQQQVVNIVNAPPIASFTPACIALTCTLNGSGSSDPDGTIASYAWSFGDSTSGSGATVNHTYAAGGTYTVTLTVTDNGAATSSQTQSVTVVPPEMHVGDLDRASTSTQNTWIATVTTTIHDSSHGLLASVAVSGTWNDGSAGSCTTNANGQCTVSRSGIPKNIHSASFSVTNVARTPFVYKPANNHDPDGDSNGTSINVQRP